MKFDWTTKKAAIVTFASVYAILMMLIIVIINATAINEWLSSFFAIFSPIFIGAGIAYLCNPIFKFFERKAFKNVKNMALRKTLTTIVTYLIVLLIIVIVLWAIIPQLINSFNELGGNMDHFINVAVYRANVIINNFMSNNDDFLEYFNVEKLVKMVTDFIVSSGDFWSKLSEYLTEYISKFVVSAKNVLFGFIISVYLLLSKEKLLAGTKKILFALFQKSRAENIMDAARITDKIFGGFIVGKLINALIIGTISFVCFVIFGVPYPLLLTVIVSVTDLIPVIGPFIGAIPCGIIVLISDPSKFIILILIIIVIQQLDGTILGPMILGDSTGLSALGVIVAILITSGYLGLLGMFIGVPIFAVLLTFANKLIDKKLEMREMPVELSEYYAENALIIPPKKEKKVLVIKIKESVIKLYDNIKEKFKSKK